MEEYIEHINKKLEMLNKQDFIYTWTDKDVEAVENLIARYKETKQELESVKEIYYTQKEIETNYIKKSKVKEIKEACEKVIETAQGEELLIFEAKLDVCEELLED